MDTGKTLTRWPVFVDHFTVEIAELTGKEHRNVLRDIRKMLEELNAGNAANLLI
ncbi:hypothetical protein C5K08_24335 [Shigella flexneri]|nr:hypothetical protein C5K08_24335 [Shigella flexneri]